MANEPESKKQSIVTGRFGNSIDSRPDAALVSDCLGGDKRAWEALLSRYQGFIFSIALRRGLVRADAEDVFQNVCIKLYEHLAELREVERLSGWLASVTVRECAQLFRRETPRLFSEALEEGDDSERLASIHASPVATPEEEVLALERAYQISVSLKGLSEECRRLLTLLYKQSDGGSYSEVADKLSIPLGSIGPKRARCLARLRVLLSKVGY